ncbi:hypothetical protein C8_118 [Cannes 8 virus]|uniref:hypothetical protein n=1 Tax=Melbournevirus TaxID=1560514 RepID=UPI000392BC40|nr:hypothetical protein MEL_100 [Melbournevirus]AGV01467.1 hypothetical protein C8_118 [Cannes 8 virus]AIT54713.1 hypothetical protein MEL_100 [Melbournevirus]AVR52828.1 hypothetical protein MarSH_123 [Marseillevirus Shanghai 1]
MSIDTSALLNLILNSAIQQLSLNKENTEKPQTNNSSSSSQPPQQDERPNLLDLFEPSPSPPIVSMKSKRQLMALGTILIQLQRDGELPCRVNSAINVWWPENEYGKLQDFSNNILENSQSILGEGTHSLDFVDNVLSNINKYE